MPAGGEVAQKACLLEGLTQLLAVTPGDFAVILHSDPDCANLVWRDFRAVDPTRFFCTNLTESEVISGATRPVLEQAIRSVASGGRADTVFVIGSCVASLLAEDIRDIVSSLEQEVACRLVAVHTEAFRLYGQAHVLDIYTHAMWAMDPDPCGGTGRSVNLLGFPPSAEWTRILSAMGAAVNAAPAVGDPPCIWGSVSGGALNVTTDVRLFARLIDEMRSQCRTQAVEVAPPYGVQASRAFYDAVREGLGLPGEAAGALDEASAEADRALARGRDVLAGTRLGYHVAGRKDFSLDVVVREGLSCVQAFQELGMDVHLLLQGSTEGRAGRRVRDMLARYGFDLPVRSVPDRVGLTHAVRELGLDAVHCSDSLREEVARAGVPLIPIGAMRPGLDGHVENVAMLERLRTAGGQTR